MDAKLKDSISGKIRLARKELEDDPGLKVKLEKYGQKLSLSGDRKCPQNALQILVERKLRKQRIWKELRIELVSAGLAGFIREFEHKESAAAAKIEISAARAKQLLLFPDFPNLPTRIRKGRNFQQFPEVQVPQFLEYAGKYQTRAQRDQQTAEELQRLALAVAPYKEAGLTVAEAFERAQAEAKASAVVVMVPRKA
jgi:hypothetical protein